MKEKSIKFYKEVSETPLEAISRFRNQNPIYADSKIAYAGRLDPMARGQLLLLIDDECKKRDDYQGMDKTYEFEVLFGLGSDSHDILGIVEQGSGVEVESNVVKKISESFEGRFDQEYPYFSSMNVDGKPLWKWYREGRINEIKIPSKEVEIYQIDFVDDYEIDSINIKEIVKEKIQKLFLLGIHLLSTVLTGKKFRAKAL